MLDDSVDLVLALDYIINLAEPHARRLNKVDPYRSCKSFIINKNRQILFSAAEEKSDQNNRPTNSSIVSVCVHFQFGPKSFFRAPPRPRCVHKIICPTHLCTETKQFGNYEQDERKPLEKKNI